MNFDKYDQDVQQWIQTVLTNYRQDPDTTLKYSNFIVSYGTETNDSRLIGIGYFYIAISYYHLNDGEKFFETVSKALNHLENAKEWEYIAKCYNLLGIIAMSRGNLPVAYDYYLSGIAYCEKYNFPDIKVILDNNCAAINFQSKRYKAGLKYIYDSLDYVRQHPESADYHRQLLCLYENIALSKVMQGCFDEAADTFKLLHEKYLPNGDQLDKIGCTIAEALYYHKSGQSAKRDEIIAEIDNSILQKAYFDLMDDYFMYAEMLLECDKDTEFLNVITALENIAEKVNQNHISLQTVSLKMKYFQKTGNRAEFSQASEVYYKLSEERNEEMLTMMNCVMTLRNNLEDVNKEKLILAEKSEHDALTHLANRAKLKIDAEKAYNTALMSHEYLTVEILDIDYFKEFNDNYGHQTGDEGIKTVADCIKDIADRHNAISARYGGDEFVLIYSGLSPSDAASCAKELKQMILDRKVEHKFSKIGNLLTVSQGLCCDIPTDRQTVWDFLKAADDMLYNMKKSTRNNYCVGNSAKTLLI